MPTKWIYEPRDLVWLACCRTAYGKLVARTAAGCEHVADTRRLPELLRETGLTPMDFAADVEAARQGKPPRLWPDAESVTITEVEDEPALEISATV